MTTDQQIDERLRGALDHVARTTTLTPDLEDVVRRASRDTGQRSTRRRWTVTGIAVALVATGAVGAAATGVFSPDPADIDSIMAAADNVADVHLPGWRPVLNAEAVWCVYEDGPAAMTVVSEFPIDEAMTEAQLLTECRSGNDAVRSAGQQPTSVTLCSGVRSAAGIREELAIGRVVAGSTADRPDFPVVLGWQTDCAEADVGDLAVELSEFDGVEEINRARELEVAFEAHALSQECLSREDATSVARQAATRLADGWFVFEPRLDGDADCYRVDLNPELGAVMIWGHEPGGRDG